jgi:hypothetical protein
VQRLAGERAYRQESPDDRSETGLFVRSDPARSSEILGKAAIFAGVAKGRGAGGNVAKRRARRIFF